MLLDAFVLVSLIEALVAAFVATGTVVLPAGRRGELVRILMSALIGPVARDEYCSALEGELTRHGIGQGANVPLAEFPAEALLREGLGVLTDDQLARLAVSPAAIRSLNERVWQAMADGSVGEPWWEACDSIAEGLPTTYLGEDAHRRIVNHIRELEND